MASSKVKKNLAQDADYGSIEVWWQGEVFVEHLATTLTLADLTPSEIREALNLCPAKYAFWAYKVALLDHALAALNAKYEMWYAAKYKIVDKDPSAAKRRSEGAKKNQVVLDYGTVMKGYYRKKYELELNRDKAAVLAHAFDMQSRTLQTVSGSVRAEMDLLVGAKGKRNLIQED